MPIEKVMRLTILMSISFFLRGIDFFFSNAIVDSLNKIGIGQHCYLFSYILLHLG